MMAAAKFTWSYSALKNFETCPKRYYHYQVAKDVTEPESPQLAEGKALHDHFANRLGPKATPLPLGYGRYEGMLGKLKDAPGELLVEKKLALTSSFAGTTFFGRDVWFRTVIDVAVINGPHAALIDWKTGRVAEDDTQLALMAATIFAQAPTVMQVKASLVFVAHDQTVPATYVRESTTGIWAEILPRVKRVEQARAAQDYPPTPSRLCQRYCAVLSCPYHGKRL